MDNLIDKILNFFYKPEPETNTLLSIQEKKNNPNEKYKMLLDKLNNLKNILEELRLEFDMNNTCIRTKEELDYLYNLTLEEYNRVEQQIKELKDKK